ncbi:hypothetical protein RFI_38455 [Reticulomyxa filosa]|uniref:Ubiquitin-like domain-containing protein n=1 Tax=Reticulomyxa filosa TaxID=46433 RepID=X6LD31_RETFI|nr:hypothetical protein RFI_38455 [Reticulomyxa filosa]|eukprot:ETN99031.1 hypothetical protein RFI_38455 [Reticulomyxa filosa]
MSYLVSSKVTKKKNQFSKFKLKKHKNKMATYDMSPLDLADRITVHIQVSNSIGIQTGNLSLHKHATLAELCEEIYSKLEVPVDKQSLEMDGINFDKAEKLTVLSELGLKEKSVIKLFRTDNEEIILDPSMSDLSPAENLVQTQSTAQRIVSQEDFVNSVIDANTLAAVEAQITALEVQAPPSQVNSHAVLLLQRWIDMSFFFAVEWGYLDMLYYLFGLLWAILGWFGCRRLSVPSILIFSFILVVQEILLFNSLISGTGRNDVIIFLVLVTILGIFAWMFSLWRFAWLIYTERQRSPWTIRQATEKCRNMPVCI